jgi:hypothetical protein
MGSYGVQAERRFWVWGGYLSKYFCRERNLVHVCALRERDGWMRVRDGIGITISGCTYGLDVLRWILLGRRQRMMRIGMVGLDTMSVNLRNESAL